jgi:hypothetical protein
MKASQLHTLMMRSRLLTQALCILTLFVIFGVQANAQNCTSFADILNVPPSLGNSASLNGFLPFKGTPATEYGPSAWNYNISGAAADPNSAAIIQNIMGEGTNVDLYPNFGPDTGIPYVVVDTSVQPSIDMNGPAAGPPGPTASQSDDVVEPAPLSAPIEGGQPDCLDWPEQEYNFGNTHMLVVDRAQCFLYETNLTSRCNGVFTVGGQTLWDLQYGEVRPYGWASTDTAGLPVFPGLVKYDEACALYADGACQVPGIIRHAFRFTLDASLGDSNGGYFVFPAGHAKATNGVYTTGPNDGLPILNEMGMRLRLNPSTDISGYSPINQAILTAMMNYGLILADNGDNMYVSGATDARWDATDLANLEQLTAADFEVIQMSPEDACVASGTPAACATGLGAANTDIADGYVGMDANSAPYTVADVVAGTYAGGLGPEGTSESGDTPLTGDSEPADGPTGVTPGPPPTINSMTVNYEFLGFIPISYPCADPGIYEFVPILPGTAITLDFNITSTIPNFYSYIDNYGPVRVDGSGDGSVTFTPDAGQAYTLYSMNAYGMAESASCNLPLLGSTLPVPVLSPASGTYSTIINVQITEPGYPGAAIYYTTDGTTPTYPTTGTTQLYTGPITITNAPPPGEQINAIAVDTSLFVTPSGVGSALYVVNGQAATPVISPPSGTYNLPQTVTITDTTNPIDINQDHDATYIYYTTDGTAPGGNWYGVPTGNSHVCAVGPYGSGPCTFNLVGGITTVKAVADAVGYTQSLVATATYDVPITFTVAVNPTILIINPENDNTGSTVVTVTSLNGYSGTVNLKCSGLPAGDACVFNPPSVSVTPSTAGSSTLTINAGLNAHNNSFPLLPGGTALAVALCFFGFRKRRRLQMIVLLAASAIGLSLFTGCGSFFTTPEAVIVTITGTDSSGSPSANAPLTLVQLLRVLN